MSATITCPVCGRELPQGVSPERCPRCLLRLALSEPVSEDGETEIREVAAREELGSLIDRYKLLCEIGEGGFGIVYLAEQTEPVRRKVALKVIKPGMDTREVVARFEAERQALALMDHPNIARVYDGGATASGRPYFVMELVEGIPLTKYCDEHLMNLRERLELFRVIAAAVQHAHQKGIIHRDLKPSNILVYEHDGRPEVKVIDFGIAKAVSMELTEKTLRTAYGRMIGTPQYMSPEQAELKVLDIDTRSDIYSLGTILYELLTGRTPLDPAVLRKADYAELQVLIREQEALKPSAFIALRRQTRPAPSAERRVPPWLSGPVARDLDWVVMKALEKDRSRRYQTVNGFALDVRRYLANEPVSASPPSTTYRFKKFARRNRFAVAWTAVFSVFVIGAAIGMTLLYFHAQEEAKIARSKTREALISQAAALRWSGKPGRRFEAFTALTEAAAIPSALDEVVSRSTLRDEAIACFALVDARISAEWAGNPGFGGTASADRTLTRYASTFPDGAITVSRYPQRTVMEELPGHGEKAGPMLDFSPDGKRLAVVYGEERMLRIWKLGSGGEYLDVGSVANEAFDFLPDGKHCVIGRATSVAAVVKIRTGESVSEFSLPGIPYAIRANRDGTLLAISLQGMESQAWSVEVLDARSGGVLGTLDCPDPRAVAWSPFDDSLAVCGGDGVLRVWPSREWASAPLELDGHTDVPDAVVWSPDGRLLASQALDGTVRLWDPFQGTPFSWHSGRGSGLVFSADGSRLGLLFEGETTRVLEIATGDVCYRGRRHVSERNRGTYGKAPVFTGIWNREGTLMATSGDDGVRLWNREGRSLGLLPVRRARGLAFSAEALYVGSEAGLFRYPMRWRAAPEGGLEAVFGAAETRGAFFDCGELALFPDGEQLALAGQRRGATATDAGAAIWLVDLAEGGKARRLPSPVGTTYCAVSRDGLWLAAGTREGTGVRVWALPDATEPVDIPTRGGATVAFSQEDETKGEPVKWLVTGDTGSYRFFRTGSWEADPARVLASEMGGVPGAMVFSPRETAFAIAYRRAELQFYDPDSLVPLSRPDFDRESPLCFDPYGMIMATAGQSGGIFFWKLDAVRVSLGRMDLDWTEMKEMPALPVAGWPPPLVRRVVFTEDGK